MKWLLKVNL